MTKNTFFWNLLPEDIFLIAFNTVPCQIWFWVAANVMASDEAIFGFKARVILVHLWCDTYRIIIHRTWTLKHIQSVTYLTEYRNDFS